MVVKQLFGGIGSNFMNPALAGRAVPAGQLCHRHDHLGRARCSNGCPCFGSNADVVTAATPLAIMKGRRPGRPDAATTPCCDMFMGSIGGSLGEVSALMLLLGGVYLVVRKVISWHIPVAFIATVAVLT